MLSKWQHVKQRAISMRRHGASVRDIEKRLGIRRSTLSYWFTKVPLSKHHLRLLKKRADKALVKARVQAVKWHNARKRERVALAENEARQSLSKLNLEQIELLELALAMLYLGEGAKKNSQTSLGNSSPEILAFFVHALQKLYGATASDFKCYLHLRADQNQRELRRFWSRTLGIPESRFGKTLVDHRTQGSSTYPNYKGVCAVTYSRVAVKRKLLYIADVFCSHVAENMRG
ncbi:MAG: hypothetical protein Q7S01_02710 [bacterium]|nr:hypothetical protein [bacterium]